MRWLLVLFIMFKYLLLVLSSIATPLDGLLMVFICDSGGPCIPAPADIYIIGFKYLSLVLSSIAPPANRVSAL